MRRPLAPVVTALLLVLAPTVAAAQDGVPRPPAANVVSVNPLYLPLGMFVAEYEHAIAPSATLGLSGGYYDPIGQDDGDDDRYASAEVKFRYFPGERAPRGFSIGASAGLAHFIYNNSCCTSAGDLLDNGSETAPTFGVVLDYNWLLGRNRRFFVGTGVGAKRLLGNRRDDDFFDELTVIPTVRLQVGAAF